MALEGCLQDDLPEMVEYVHVGDTMPRMVLTMNDGSKVDNSLMIGKNVVLVFFSTKCSDCQKELPVVQEFYEHVADNNDIMVIAISRGEDSKVVEPFWHNYNLTIPYSAQNDCNVYNLFASQGVPRIYIADPNGFITHTFTDSDMPSLQELRECIGDTFSALHEHP